MFFEMTPRIFAEYLRDISRRNSAKFAEFHREILRSFSAKKIVCANLRENSQSFLRES